MSSLAKEGLCGSCRQPLPHGPYSDEEIAEICADVGSDPEEFEDWCDDCFLAYVGGHDVQWAESLLRRPLQLRRPVETIPSLLFSRPVLR